MATTIRDFHVIGHTDPPKQLVYGESTVRHRMVPAHELWFWQSTEARAAVVRGLIEMDQGQTTDLGSFAQYADLDVDE